MRGLSEQLAMIIGKRFGRWAVLSFSHHTERSRAMFLCECDCGTRRLVDGARLKAGGSASCGCVKVPYNRDKKSGACHGHSPDSGPSRTYISWSMMIQRCCNPRASGFVRYGARGIVVCEQWRNNFAQFLSDMGERPDGMSLDRIDGDGNYEPKNCRWADRKTQQRHMRKK